MKIPELRDGRARTFKSADYEKVAGAADMATWMAEASIKASRN
jgi:hypothetical protein